MICPLPIVHDYCRSPGCRPERKISPPCPHQWESHEDIDKLEAELKQKKVKTSADSIKKEKLGEKLESLKNLESFESKVTQQITQEVRQWINQSITSTTMSSTTKEPSSSDGEDHVYYEATTKHSSMVKSPGIVLDAFRDQINSNLQANDHLRSESVQPETSMMNHNSKDTIPPPIPPKTKTNALTPSPSRQEISPCKSTDDISSQSTVQSTVMSAEYIRVREKVKHFEQKVEEDFIRQSLEDYSETSTTIRPENIPGAVRILPTPTPPGSRPGSRTASRKNSLARSSSTEPGRPGLFSPINTPRSVTV